MATLDLLRKIIREEVKAVFQEELAGILKEAITVNRNPVMKESTQPSRPQQLPGTLNRTAPRVVAPNLGVNNPLNSILAETAQSMTDNDLESLGGSGDTQRDVPIVESVNGMFAAARPSSNLDAIEINAVPDFTGLMAKMKANGEI
jgi:hypothetical protein